MSAPKTYLADSEPLSLLLFNHAAGNAYVEPDGDEVEAIQSIAEDAENLLTELANEGNQFGYLGIPGRWTVSVDDDGDVEWRIDRLFRVYNIGNTAILHMGPGRSEQGRASDTRENMRRVAAAWIEAENNTGAAVCGGEDA